MPCFRHVDCPASCISSVTSTALSLDGARSARTLSALQPAHRQSSCRMAGGLREGGIESPRHICAASAPACATQQLAESRPTPWLQRPCLRMPWSSPSPAAHAPKACISLCCQTFSLTACLPSSISVTPAEKRTRSSHARWSCSTRDIIIAMLARARTPSPCAFSHRRGR